MNLSIRAVQLSKQQVHTILQQQPDAQAQIRTSHLLIVAHMARWVRSLFTYSAFTPRKFPHSGFKVIRDIEKKLEEENWAWYTPGQGGKMPENVRKVFLIHLLQALDFLHTDAKMIHADIEHVA